MAKPNTEIKVTVDWREFADLAEILAQVFRVFAVAAEEAAKKLEAEITEESGYEEV